MRALIVGAGAVGQVYGRCLRAGGARSSDLAYLVKPVHADQARAGFTLYPLGGRRHRPPRSERLDGFEVLTGPDQVAGQRWDQVYLAVSSTALRAGDWFARLVPAIGQATLVLLQPGPEDRQFVLRALPAGQLVQGTITAVAYRAPLPGEEGRYPQPGTAYWLPPAPAPFSGPRERLDPVVAALRAGGMRARRVRDVEALVPFATALFMPVLAVLEQAGWSLAELGRGDRLARALRAGREAMRVTAAQVGRRAPWPLRLVRPWAVRALLRLAPRVAPLDLQAYLRVHFTKVGDQTRDFLRHYLAGGEAAGLPVETLRQVAAVS
jgi:2-dehydropantoate 2-reductase